MKKRIRKGVPPASSPASKKRMESARQRDTEPEVRLRSLLHRMGLRYRVHRRPLPGLRRAADLLFRKAKVVVYLDGCFWHGCPLHATWPKQNAEFWREKIETNRRRDADTNRRLREAGWLVIRVWEHEDAATAAAGIVEAVRSRLSPAPAPA